MANSSPRHPLRDMLAARDDTAPVDWLTGVVVDHQETEAPYTVMVRLADGTVIGPVTYLAWWAPALDDVVHMVRQGTRVMVWGPEAPANTVPPPVFAVVPPPAPPAPPAQATVRTVTVQPVDMAYWSQWGWKSDELIQGGPANRALWLYGTGIADAVAGGVIIAGSVYVQRVAAYHGVNGPANVRLGTHGYTTRPAGAPAALTAVNPSAAQLLRGKDANVPLSQGELDALNAGARGLGLEPGNPSYAHPDYLRATAGGASGALSLTVRAVP